MGMSQYMAKVGWCSSELQWGLEAMTGWCSRAAMGAGGQESTAAGAACEKKTAKKVFMTPYTCQYWPGHCCYWICA